MRKTIRKAGGSLAMTVPEVFTEQRSLSEGSPVDLHRSRKTMTVAAQTRPSYKLVDLMAEMPEGLPRADGWDEMPSVGLESG